jgi:hypothetical protein
MRDWFGNDNCKKCGGRGWIWTHEDDYSDEMEIAIITSVYPGYVPIKCTECIEEAQDAHISS